MLGQNFQSNIWPKNFLANTMVLKISKCIGEFLHGSYIKHIEIHLSMHPYPFIQIKL